jgi:hypothetical protein
MVVVPKRMKVEKRLFLIIFIWKKPSASNIRMSTGVSGLVRGIRNSETKANSKLS